MTADDTPLRGGAQAEDDDGLHVTRRQADQLAGQLEATDQYGQPLHPGTTVEEHGGPGADEPIPYGYGRGRWW